MKKIKERFKSKYLFVLLLPLAVLVFTKVSASKFIVVTTKEDYKKAVVRAYLSAKGDFEIDFYVKFNEKFTSLSKADSYCNLALEGMKEELSQFHNMLLSCSAKVLSSDGGANVFLTITKGLVTPEFYDEVMNFVETEGDKMYAQTTDKEQLIKKVYDKMNEMLASRHKYFFEEGTIFYYQYSYGWNLLASLFYDYFNIENHVIFGQEGTYGRTWNLVKLGANWYHIDNSNFDNIYLISDFNVSKKRTWDNGAYPKASKDYVTATVSENTTIVPIITAEDIEDVGTVETPTNPVDQTDKSIGASSWAKDGVSEAIKSGIVPLKLQERYQTSITREEFCELVVMIYETMKGTYNPLEKQPFSDTNNLAIAKAFELKIVNGVGGGRFAPKNLVTREQIAVMFDNLISALNIQPDLNSNYILFADDAEISGWAKESVQVLVKLNIMNGVGSNRVNPKGNATIEQAILLGNKLYKLYK